jgi:hypothetical protein
LLLTAPQLLMKTVLFARDPTTTTDEDCFGGGGQ